MHTQMVVWPYWNT